MSVQERIAIGKRADRRFGELLIGRARGKSATEFRVGTDAAIPPDVEARAVLGASNIVAVVAWKSAETNGPMVEAWRRMGIPAYLLEPPEARLLLRSGDVAIVRLDVLPTLDGVEEGILDLAALKLLGVRLVNTPAALLAAHDKLETSRRLDEADVPHPPTAHITSLGQLSDLALPFVVKPRFGSWGRDVMLCRNSTDLRRCAAVLQDRAWFARHGALVQEFVPVRRHDLRLLVAGDRVVGAAERRAAPGEWRTNVSLGGTLAPVKVPPTAAEPAVRAARAIRADFVGVDLLPTSAGAHVVLELNGAADFDERYSIAPGDVFADVAASLGFAPMRVPLAKVA